MSTRNVQYIIELRDKFTKNLKGVNAAVNTLNKNTSQFTQTFNALGVSFGAIGAIQLGKSILKLGIDMEQTEVAFTTLLQSAEKAKSLLEDLKRFAATTPFQLPEILEASKQLLAYGFAQEQIIDTTRMLGDVAAGLKIPLGDLNYLFGTLKAQGRVMAIDVRQFAMRGIPIYKELAKVLKVDQNEVNALVSAGKVGFSDIEQVFKNLTAEGGQFFNLMASQSQTVGGQLSNFKDTVGLIGIELGKSFLPQISELIKRGQSLTSWIQNNADTVKRMIDIVLQAAKAFVIFKTTIFAITKGLVIYQKILQVLQYATIAYTRGIKVANRATQAFNATMKANIIGLVITGIVLLIQKMRSLKDKTKDATDQQAKFNEQLRFTNQLISNGEQVFAAAQQSLDGLTKLSINELQAGLDVAREAMNNFREDVSAISLPNGQIIQIDVAGNKKRIVDAMKRIQAELDRRGISTMTGDGGKTTIQQRETTITSRSPKVININIQKLIETQEINTKTLTESTPQIKKLITQTIMEALNDTQIAQRAS